MSEPGQRTRASRTGDLDACPVHGGPLRECHRRVEDERTGERRYAGSFYGCKEGYRCCPYSVSPSTGRTKLLYDPHGDCVNP